MTAHETTPSDAAIGQAFREAHKLALDNGRKEYDVAYNFILDRASEIEQGRELPWLPISYGDICIEDSVRVMREPGYTADQLRAYGEACRRMGNRDE